MEALHGRCHLKQVYERKFDAMSQRVTLCGSPFCTLSGKKHKGLTEIEVAISYLITEKYFFARGNLEYF